MRCQLWLRPKAGSSSSAALGVTCRPGSEAAGATICQALLVSLHADIGQGRQREAVQTGRWVGIAKMQSVPLNGHTPAPRSGGRRRLNAGSDISEWP